MRRVVVVSDLQCPFEHKRAVRALERFIESLDSDDSVICVGDEMDAPQISRWTKGRQGEFLADLGKHRDHTFDVLGRLKIKHLSRSNHTDRPERYIETYAPGLLGLPELRYEQFMRLNEIGCTYHRTPYRVAREWYLLHGDEGRLSPLAGQTALKLAMARNTSVVCGHSHRAGLAHHSYSLAGNLTKQIWGLEVGMLIDTYSTGVAYAKGTANWALSFGIMYIDDNDRVKAMRPVMVERNGSFLVSGKMWEA